MGIIFEGSGFGVLGSEDGIRDLEFEISDLRAALPG
jgi:hypothetical protein